MATTNDAAARPARPSHSSRPGRTPAAGTGRKRPAGLDRIDRQILAILQEQGNIANVELAARVHLSPAPCLRRVAALEAAGYIRRYAAVLDPARLGLQLLAFVSVKLVKGGKRPAEQFHAAVETWAEVTGCWAVTGDMDYLLRVQVGDLPDYSRFMNDRLLRHPGVIDVRSSIAIEAVKETTALAVG